MNLTTEEAVDKSCNVLASSKLESE